ncbi:glycosyltransferase family 9 protein [Dyadobacter sp. CY312]|uniref:glycosyltransferase family 9 protein n=1 Tax=Dyadobacter sp. CY312 TaxID=2907303 RepID=UPI001F23C18B|nr:glycosyltransferase family 9 protein [Dyadobacter sp. CY312]MCE7041552.1 glycosyltransferase family 9 protein [Dyadobacter sp. CY312]
MTISRFRQLWTHRYFKYTHIFNAHLLGYFAALRFYIKKAELKKGQELISIIRTEHFGDIVAAEPLARYVRELHPNAYIVWFVKPSFHELVDYNPEIDEVLKEFCVTQRRTIIGTRVFDKVYELQFRNNNHCTKCDVFTDNPVAEARGINVHNYFTFGNLLEVFAKTSGIIPLKDHFPADDQPRLYLQDHHRIKADSLQLKKPYIVVHCQSNFAPKDWPADRWQQLIAWITANYGYQIVEIGLKSNLMINTGSYTNLCGKLTILETAEVIRRADYFIGLDSGPSHLGNATGTFGIILMGALTTFASYNPYSGSYGRQENALLVRKEGLACAELSFEFVRDEVKKVLGE